MKSKIFLCLLFVPFLSYAKVSVGRMQEIYFNLININQIQGAPIQVDLNDDTINATTTRSKIIITKKDLDVLSEAELAAVLGHELAHFNNLDSIYHFPGKYQENRADYYGALYAARIGYSRCDQAKIFLRFKKLYGDQGGEFDRHASNAIRYNRLMKGCK